MPRTPVYMLHSCQLWSSHQANRLEIDQAVWERKLLSVWNIKHVLASVSDFGPLIVSFQADTKLKTSTWILLALRQAIRKHI